MKKLFKSLLVLVLCVCSVLTFVGCKDVVWSKTTNDTTKVTSNGGSVVYHDGWMYFINGTKSVSAANNSGSTIKAGIYRAKTDDNGNVLYEDDSIVQSHKKDEKKSFKQVEPVVQSLVGFDNGSLFIFGDYLYYATPSKGVNDEGTMLTGKVAFYRYDLINKNSGLLYTTKASDDTISYTYYKQGSDLYLVVYEKTSKTLTSLKMGDAVHTTISKGDVKSVVFSSINGEVNNQGTNVTDCYIYFTMDAEGNNSGNRVFRILPNGTEEKLISEKEDVSLITIQSGFLVYKKGTFTYAQKVLYTTKQLSFSVDNIVHYNEYDGSDSKASVMYIEENGKLGALVYESGIIRKIVWDSSKTINENVDAMQPIYDELDPDDELLFVGLDGDYLIYQLSNLIYKVKVLNIGASDEIQDIQLSTTKMDAAKDNSLIGLEIINGYVYGMYTDSKASVTYMYRINIQTPEEAGVVDEDGKTVEVGDAEFIGVKE